MTSVFKLLKLAFFLTLFMAEGMASPSSLWDWKEESTNSTPYPFVASVTQSNSASSSSNSASSHTPFGTIPSKTSAPAKRKPSSPLPDNPRNTSGLATFKSASTLAQQIHSLSSDLDLDFSLDPLDMGMETLFPEPSTNTNMSLAGVRGDVSFFSCFPKLDTACQKKSSQPTLDFDPESEVSESESDTEEPSSASTFTAQKIHAALKGSKLLEAKEDRKKKNHSSQNEGSVSPSAPSQHTAASSSSSSSYSYSSSSGPGVLLSQSTQSTAQLPKKVAKEIDEIVQTLEGDEDYMNSLSFEEWTQNLEEEGVIAPEQASSKEFVSLLRTFLEDRKYLKKLSQAKNTSDYPAPKQPAPANPSATDLSQGLQDWDTLFPSTATSTQQDMSSVDLSQWELGFLPFNHSNQPPALNQSADSSTTTALTSSSFSASAIIPLQSAPASSAHMSTTPPIESEDSEWEVDDMSSSTSTDESEEEWSLSEVLPKKTNTSQTTKGNKKSMQGNKKELPKKPLPLKKKKSPKDPVQEIFRESNARATKKYRDKKKERLGYLCTLAQQDSSLAESLSLIEKGLTTTLLEESKRRDLEKKAIDTNLTRQQRKRESTRIWSSNSRKRVREELKLLEDYLADHPEKANKDEDETHTLKQSWSSLIIEALKDSALKERNPDKKWKVADAIAFLETTEKFTDFFGDNPSSKSSTITQILQRANIWQMSQKGYKRKESVIDLDASTQIPHSGANIAGYLRAYAEHRGGPHLYILGQATEVLKNSGRFESLFGNKYSKNLISDALKRAEPPLFKYTNEAESSTNSSTSSSVSATAVPSTHGQVMDESEDEGDVEAVPVQPAQSYHPPMGAHHSFAPATHPLTVPPHDAASSSYSSFYTPHNPYTLYGPYSHTPIGTHHSFVPMAQFAPATHPLTVPPHDGASSSSFSVTTTVQKQKSFLPQTTETMTPNPPHGPLGTPTQPIQLENLLVTGPAAQASLTLPTLSQDVRTYFLKDIWDQETDAPLQKLTVGQALTRLLRGGLINDEQKEDEGFKQVLTGFMQRTGFL